MLKFVGLLLGEDVSQALPHPETDIDGFMKSLRSQVGKEERQFNIMTNRVTRIIDMYQLELHLKKQIGGGVGCKCVIS